jgi:large subunit ribosomal protein L3
MVPVTLLQVEQQKITKLVTSAKEGYDAYQIGYASKAEKNLTKPDVARLRKAGIQDSYSRFIEFRPEKMDGYSVGQALDVAALDGVLSVDVTGITKGRGFTGSVKKWKTACGRMTHGSRFHRRPGSLGTRTTPGRVFKGKPQHGHYGVEQVTIQNLAVLDVDKESNVIAICGSVPGHRNGYLVLRPSVKA